jgi:hypothetical protein
MLKSRKVIFTIGAVGGLAILSGLVCFALFYIFPVYLGLNWNGSEIPEIVVRGKVYEWVNSPEGTSSEIYVKGYPYDFRTDSGEYVPEEYAPEGAVLWQLLKAQTNITITDTQGSAITRETRESVGRGSLWNDFLYSWDTDESQKYIVNCEVSKDGYEQVNKIFEASIPSDGSYCYSLTIILVKSTD